MISMKRVLTAGALALAVATTAAPASANTGGTCNGSVDTNCSYCSYASGNTGQDRWWCDNHYSGYTWELCEVWVLNTCVVG